MQCSVSAGVMQAALRTTGAPVIGDGFIGLPDGAAAETHALRPPGTSRVCCHDRRYIHPQNAAFISPSSITVYGQISISAQLTYIASSYKCQDTNPANRLRTGDAIQRRRNKHSKSPLYKPADKACAGRSYAVRPLTGYTRFHPGKTGLFGCQLIKPVDFAIHLPGKHPPEEPFFKPGQLIHKMLRRKRMLCRE